MKTLQPLLYETDLAAPLKICKERPQRKAFNQYFTPKDIVYLSLSLIYDEKPKKVIDPAVGEGVFLEEAEALWPQADFWGIDIDHKLISKHLKTARRSHFYLVGDSLQEEVLQKNGVKEIFKDQGGFDLVVGNPPFSSWFGRINDEELLKQYELGQKEGGKIVSSQAIEILFLERFIKLTKPEGAIVIVLPNGILSNPQHQSIREYILKRCTIKYIVNVPRGVFSGTQAKTAILIMSKKKETATKNYEAAMINIEKKESNYSTERLLVGNTNLAQRMDYSFYEPGINNTIKKVLQKNKFIKMEELTAEVFTGATAYGADRFFSEKGELKFLSPKNIVKTGIDFYRDFKLIVSGSKMDHEKAHAKINDFLFTRVGAGCAGRVAVVSREKDMGVVNDYIFVMRLEEINPYYLFLMFKSEYGRALIEKYKQHGAGTVSISQKSVLEFQIPLIGSLLMAEFTQQLQEKVICLHNKAIDYKENDDEPGYKEYLKSSEANLQNIIMEFNKVISRG